MRFSFLLLSITLLAISCKDSDKLPFLGVPEILDGKEVPHTVGDFSFMNQDSLQVTQSDYQDQIQIADFFFTTCPTICPTVMSNMVKIYDKYEKNEDVRLVSFSLDPKKDTVGALKEYADNLEVSSPKWNLLTGEKKKLHGMAADYFNIVVEDDEAPGGINHSGKIILVDKKGRVRAYAEGTDENEVEKFMEDIDKLLKEYEVN